MTLNKDCQFTLIMIRRKIKKKYISIIIKVTSVLGNREANLNLNREILLTEMELSFTSHIELLNFVFI